MKNDKPLFLIVFLLFSVSSNMLIAQPKGGQTIRYGKASYDSNHTGGFMKSWFVAGPFAIGNDRSEPSEADQENSFKGDDLIAISASNINTFPLINSKEKTLNWRPLSSSDDLVDLDAYYKGKDFVYAYALAEIKAAKPGVVFLGLGSDDGVKVWLNGKLVHNNWVPRGTERDNDLVPLTLSKGSNQLLLKVQDIRGGWAFMARLLDASALSNKLSAAAASGSLEEISLLLAAGASVNGKNTSGLTPLQAAKLSGRVEIIDLLLKKGATDQPLPPAETLIDAYYASLKGKKAPGIALLVAKEGKVLYKKGHGYADINNNVPVTADTKFRIGSVTKQFTAAAILKLQENSMLSVNDKLSKFIPDFPRGDEVTLHHLLTHTSGIHSYTNNPDFLENVTKTITLDSLVRLIKKAPYDFSPGERFLYNNSGYALLGYIIENVSKKTYGDYLKETFFVPLHMNNTGVHHAGIRLENEARGYAKNNGRYEEALNWDMSWAGAAGALYSTVDDLLKWNEALYAGKVLREESLAAAMTPVVLRSGQKSSTPYGYGLGFSQYRGIEMVSHSGGLHGFITQLAYYPKEKVSVVMFSNTAEPEVTFNPNTIVEAYLWNKMENQRSYVVSSIKPKDLQVYTGRYELSGIGVMRITTEEDRLYIQLSGQPRFELFPLVENEFFLKVVDARLKFVKGEKGEVTHSILYQNGQEVTAKKIPEEITIMVDSAVLNKYIGNYKFNNSVVTLSREGNRLFAQPADQPKLEMHAVSETEFVIKDINARIYFVKEGDGKVKKLRLNMNGVDSELPRTE